MTRHLRRVSLAPLLLFVCVCGLPWLAACGATDPQPDPDPGTPLSNFDALWHDFDRSYALFGVRAVDWSALYDVYRSRLDEDSTDVEARDVMCGLLQELGDGQSRLEPDGMACPDGAPDTLAWFHDGDPAEFWSDYMITRDLIAGHYLDDPDTSRAFNWISRVATQDKHLLYLELDSFDDRAGEVDWDEVAARFAAAPECDGLIIDVRANAGGRQERVLQVANAVASSPREYYRRYLRDGPGHDDFTPPRPVEATPAGTAWGQIPVVVLCHGYTRGAAERFVLAMRGCPNATIVGTRTRGSLSDQSHRTLPNGWRYALCDELVHDPQDRCWEATGVPTDYEVWNTRSSVAQGHDLVLEIAITVLLLRLAPPAR
ncbi:MAG: S41 family peptidase [Candidatus Krumholzibacteriia bacterium]